jgi:hypothetical protein
MPPGSFTNLTILREKFEYIADNSWNKTEILNKNGNANVRENIETTFQFLKTDLFEKILNNQQSSFFKSGTTANSSNFYYNVSVNLTQLNVTVSGPTTIHSDTEQIYNCVNELVTILNHIVQDTDQGIINSATHYQSPNRDDFSPMNILTIQNNFKMYLKDLKILRKNNDYLVIVNTMLRQMSVLQAALLFQIMIEYKYDLVKDSNFNSSVVDKNIRTLQTHLSNMTANLNTVANDKEVEWKTNIFTNMTKLKSLNHNLNLKYNDLEKEKSLYEINEEKKNIAELEKYILIVVIAIISISILSINILNFDKDSKNLGLVLLFGAAVISFISNNIIRKYYIESFSACQSMAECNSNKAREISVYSIKMQQLFGAIASLIHNESDTQLKHMIQNSMNKEQKDYSNKLHTVKNRNDQVSSGSVLLLHDSLESNNFINYILTILILLIMLNSIYLNYPKHFYTYSIPIAIGVLIATFMYIFRKNIYERTTAYRQYWK